MNIFTSSKISHFDIIILLHPVIFIASINLSNLNN